MRKRAIKFLIFYVVISISLYGQNANIKTRINNGELKMSFPSIYFKHNSTNYATMPYTVDSCFKYIATNLKDINSRPIWRDSSEAEQLTNERIKKLKADLNKYLGSKKIKIQSMQKEQKIPQRTIYSGTDSTQIQYLLSLNSVFDISRTKTLIKPHKAWHLPCWMNLQLDKSGRERCKMERRLINKSKAI
jgi:hypothetical protein